MMLGRYLVSGAAGRDKLVRIARHSLDDVCALLDRRRAEPPRSDGDQRKRPAQAVAERYGPEEVDCDGDSGRTGRKRAGTAEDASTAVARSGTSMSSRPNTARRPSPVR